MNTPPTSPADAASATAPPASAPAPRLEETIERLVELAQETSSTQAFLRGALALIARTLRATHAEIEVRHSAMLITEVHDSGEAPEDFWSPTIRALLIETAREPRPHARLFKSKTSDLRLALLAAPLRAGGGTTSGALAAVAPCADRAHAEELISILSSLTTLTSKLVESIQRGGRRVPDEAATSAAAGLSKVASFTSHVELAFALTNKLRTRDGCDQVTLAAVDGSRVRILAVSGLDEVSAKSPGIRVIQAALEECLDVGQILVHQPGSELDAPSVATRGSLHRRWHDEAGRAPVASIPLLVGGECVAILGIRRAPGTTFSIEELEEFRALVEPYAAGLEMVRRANRTLAAHTRTSLSGLGRSLLHPGSWSTKGTILALIGLLLWTLFGSVDYQITTHGSIKPAASRQVGVPFEGFLLATAVVPGDPVQKGDALCEFDTSALRLEIERMESELAILEVEAIRALAAAAPADLLLARANQRQVQASVDLIRYQVERSIVRSPLDGVVLEGDLRTRVGDFFTVGEPLFEVSGHDGWSLELEISESDVGQVTPGMTGRFASLSRPDRTQELSIVRLDPSTTDRGGRNVFMAEATTDIREEWMRPGMEGMARIDAGQRRPWWVACHRLADYLRVHWWL